MQELSCKRLDVDTLERCKLVILEEGAHTHVEEIKHKAYVIPVVRPVEEVDAFAGEYRR